MRNKFEVEKMSVYVHRGGVTWGKRSRGLAFGPDEGTAA